MASKSLLGRMAGALGRMLLQKERVGTAPGGLSYYRRTERNEHDEEIEKRWVKFPASAGHGYYDPAAIAPDWSQVQRCTARDRSPPRLGSGTRCLTAAAPCIVSIGVRLPVGFDYTHGCCNISVSMCAEMQWLNHVRSEPPSDEDIVR